MFWEDLTQMPPDNSRHLLKVHRDNKPIYNSFWTLLGTTSSECRDDEPQIPGDMVVPSLLYQAASLLPGEAAHPAHSIQTSGGHLPTCIEIWIYPPEKEPTQPPLFSYQDKALTSGDSCFSSVFSPGEVVAWVSPKRKQIQFRLFSCSFRFTDFMPFLPALSVCPAQ